VWGRSVVCSKVVCRWCVGGGVAVGVVCGGSVVLWCACRCAVAGIGYKESERHKPVAQRPAGTAAEYPGDGVRASAYNGSKAGSV